MTWLQAALVLLVASLVVVAPHMKIGAALGSWAFLVLGAVYCLVRAAL